MYISDKHPEAYTHTLSVADVYTLRQAATDVHAAMRDEFVRAGCGIVFDALELSAEQQSAAPEAKFDFVIPYPHHALVELGRLMYAYGNKDDGNLTPAIKALTL